MSPASHALIVCTTPPTAKCAVALPRVVLLARPSAAATLLADSIANSAPDLRAACAPAPHWPAATLNSSRPTRASAAMVRTMLAMPARFCSFGGAAATAACVVAAMSAMHPVEHRGDELVLVGEALVEVPNGQTGLPADGAHRQLGGIGLRHRAGPGRPPAAAAGAGRGARPRRRRGRAGPVPCVPS